MTETIRYTLLGKEDIAFGPASTFEITLADGRIVILNRVDLAAILADPALSSTHLVRVKNYTKALLPTTAMEAGRLARVTNNERGFWMDQGTQWFPINGGCVNVMEFGAKGDGVTDDTAALQAAFDAAMAMTGGGAVIVPPTNQSYKASSTLRIPTRMSLLGYGRTSAITFSGTGDLLKIGTGGSISDVHVVGVRLSNFPLDVANTNGRWAIYLDGASRSRFSRCHIEWSGTTGGGLSLLNGHSNSVHQCWFSDLQGVGIQVGTAANMTSIIETILEGLANTTGTLISVTVHGTTILGVTLETAAVGIDLLGGDSYMINGYFENLGTADIRMTSTSSVRGVKIIGCQFQSGPPVGVDLSPAGAAILGALVMEGNFFKDTHTTSPIRVNAAVTGMIGHNTYNFADPQLILGTRADGLLVVDPDNADFLRFGTDFFRLAQQGGLVLGAATGGQKGLGSINLAADIYKNNTAFTNPDYVFRRWLSQRPH